jgi:hypothetical protein
MAAACLFTSMERHLDRLYRARSAPARPGPCGGFPWTQGRIRSVRRRLCRPTVTWWTWVRRSRTRGSDPSPRLVPTPAVTRQPVQAVLVGEGDARSTIEGLLREYSLTNVCLADARHGTDLVDSYRWADVLVLPSDKEGMPLTVFEAMASGLPVVATDVVGTREVLGDAGVPVPPDPDAIAQALDLVAVNASLRAELSARGLAARHYTWERFAHCFQSPHEEAVP